MPYPWASRPNFRAPVAAGGGGGGGGASVTFVNVSSQGTASNDHTTDTHGPFSVGATQAGIKRIIAGVYSKAAFDLTSGNGSVLCNGVAMATLNGNGFSGNENIDFWYLDVAGSTTSVTITCNNNFNGMKSSVVGCYWASGVTGVPTGGRNPRAIVGAGTPQNLVITVPAGGFALYMGTNDDAGILSVFTSGPVTFDASNQADVNSGKASFGHATTSGTEAHTVNTAGDNIAEAYIACSP